MEEQASVKGIHIPINKLYVVIGILSMLCLFSAFYVYIEKYLNNPSNDLIIIIGILIILSLVLASLSFPIWIKEDKEERKLKNKKRELEHKKLDEKLKAIKPI